MKKGLLINLDVWDMVDELKPEEYTEFLKALHQYHATGEIPAASQGIRIILRKIASDNERFAGVSESRSKAGKKGAEARWQNMANMANDGKHGKNSINKDKINIKENITLKSDTKEKFVPPTVDEVTEYAQKANLDMDPSAFVDFYASKAWRVGSSPMKDWEAAARNWSRREKPVARSGTFNFDQRKTDYDALLRGL